MSRRVTINPVTRLEGDGRIDIFLDDNGKVTDAFWQITELRGFESFCQGRPAEEMTRIAPNICGVCPSAHHLAATLALDDLFCVTAPETAQLIRSLAYHASLVDDHLLHFFFLAAPDLFLPSSTKPEERNILGLLAHLGKPLIERIVAMRRSNREIIRTIFGNPSHPEGGLPGGVPRRISGSEQTAFSVIAKENIRFTSDILTLFHDTLLTSDHFLSLLENDGYQLETCFAAMVDSDGSSCFTDGTIRCITPDGAELARFAPENYSNQIAEWVEPWTYGKFSYLKEREWNGLTDGADTSLYRVGPLARVNVAERMATARAQRELEQFRGFFGKLPVQNIMATHWARLICLMQAAEIMEEIVHKGALTGREIRAGRFSMQEKGIGCVEAPRGLLFHEYHADDSGILTGLNIIPATQHNAAAISIAIRNAAQTFVQGTDISGGMLNSVEMAFRAFDPCLACTTHAVGKRTPFRIVYNKRRRD